VLSKFPTLFFSAGQKPSTMNKGIESQYSGDTILLVFPDGTGPALLSAMIAGIPFNKVHELEFAPGELRLDVNLQSTLNLYNQKVQKNRKEYEAVIKSGQEELSRLRSLNPDEIVSKKDLLIEKERLEMDEQQRKAAQARQAREEMEKEARAQRAKEIEMQKEKEKAARMENVKEMDEARMRERGITPGEENGPSPPVVIGGVFATFLGVALAGSNAGDVVQMEDSSTPADGTAPSQSVPESIPPNMNNVPFGETSQDPSPEADNLKDTLEEPRHNDASTEQSLYEQPLPTDAERAKVADMVMKDYLNEDDGGDAWLRAMTEIVQEDEDQDPNETFYGINGSDGNSFQ
jgi:hypothetical protein